jgi:hypothetical protein
MKGKYIALMHYVSKPNHIVGNLILWRNAKISDRDVVFVVGAPRSGTTLVQTIVASHPLFVSIEGETDFFSPRDLYNLNRFRSFILPKNYSEILASSRDVVTLFEKAYLLRFPPGVTPVEKTPQHAKRIGFLVRHFRRARVINVYRDGRDCFVSGQRAGVIPQARSASAFARYWVRCIDARSVLRDHQRIVDVRYEDLVADPREQIARMMSFLGHTAVEEQASSLVRGADRRSHRAHFARLAKPIDASSVGQWRTVMSPREVRAFERYAGDMLRRLGYA